MKLQQFLNASPDTRLAVSGAGSMGMETQYYGPITAAAVSKFQVKYRAQVLTAGGLVNPTGYFGPMSRAQANILCANPSITPPNNDDPLEGGAGSLGDLGLTPGITNEEVGEGDEDAEVLGLEFEAEGSDIELQAVVVDFDERSGNSDFDRYADEVSIWLDGERYATIDAEEFEESNDYRQSITLERGAIVREGDMGELTVAITGTDNLDSDDEGDQWEVAIDSVRFRDALGASISESDMDDLSRTFSFVEFAESSDLGVVVRSGDDEVNDARTIEVSDNDTTDDVPVLSFEVDINGESDVDVESMSVNVDTEGGDVNEIISAAYLYHEDDEVGSANITGGSNTVTFDDLNLTLASGETHEFEVRVDIEEEGTNYSSGASIDVDVLDSNLDDWEMEDEEGNEVSSSDRSGNASADAHTLSTEGLALELVTSTTREVYNSSNPSSSYGEFRMTVEVRAIGGTVYIPETANRSDSASTGSGMTYFFEDSSGNEYTEGTGSASFSRISGGSEQSNFVRINEGQTARFELVTTLNPEDDGQYRAQIVSVAWNDSADDPDSVSAANPDAEFRSGLRVISD